MHEIGHVVPQGHHGVHLLPQVQHRRQDQRQGDAAVLHPGQGGQHDQHEHDAAGSQQRSAREEQALQDAGHARRQQDACQQGAAAVLLLQRRADHQKQQHVAQEMVEIRVAQHMAEQPHIEQRIRQGGAVHAEGVEGGPPAGEPVQQQDTQGQQEKGQDHRRIVLQLFHGALLPAGRGGVVFPILPQILRRRNLKWPGRGKEVSLGRKRCYNQRLTTIS